MGAGRVTQVSVPEFGLSLASVLRAEGASGGFAQRLQGQVAPQLTWSLEKRLRPGIYPRPVLRVTRRDDCLNLEHSGKRGKLLIGSVWGNGDGESEAFGAQERGHGWRPQPGAAFGVTG